MDALKLIAILQQLADLGATVADLVADAKTTLSSTDEAALKAKLAELEERNSTSYARVREKLATAAQQG